MSIRPLIELTLAMTTPKDLVQKITINVDRIRTMKKQVEQPYTEIDLQNSSVMLLVKETPEEIRTIIYQNDLDLVAISDKINANDNRVVALNQTITNLQTTNTALNQTKADLTASLARTKAALTKFKSNNALLNWNGIDLS